MKTVQFNANNILCGNNYPIAYYYPIAKDLVIISTGPTYQDADIEYIQAALYNVFCENNETCEPIVNYVNNTFIITDIYSC